MVATPSRRALLGALAIGPLVAAAPASAALHGQTFRELTGSPAHPAWDRALANYRAASKAADDHWEKIEGPATDSLAERAPLPDLSFTITALNGKSATYRLNTNDLDAWDGHVGAPFRQAAAKVKTAWLDYESKRDAAYIDLDLAAIQKESNRLSERLSDAESKMFETPAPSVGALAIKLDVLWADDRDSIPVFQEHVLADVRRLGGL